MYADGPDGPLPDPAVIEALAGAPIELVLGWVVRTPTWIGRGDVPITTLMLGSGLRAAAAAGLVRPVATRLSAVPGLLAGRFRPDIAVVGAIDTAPPEGPAPAEGDGPGHGTRWRLVGSPGWALAAVRAATSVIVERWPSPPSTTEGGPALGPYLPPCRVLGLVDRAEPPDPGPEHHTLPEHEVIGRLVASLIPDGVTIQWGPGAIGASVVAALERPVGVRSGLVTDELADLAARGLLSAPAEAAYIWGGPKLRAMVGRGQLRLEEVGYTHDMTALSSIGRFVAVNTALQVGLDGAANVEKVGGRTVSGPGGHPDFAAGASRSPGGLSIVALPATSGTRSNIVATPDVVSTPRSDVDLVVTEHGIADLRSCTDAERAARILAVAAPEHRGELAMKVDAS